MVYIGLMPHSITEGVTVSEMAAELGLDPNAVRQRLFVAKIKPATKEALYEKSALEAIRNVPGKGRPRREKPLTPPSESADG